MAAAPRLNGAKHVSTFCKIAFFSRITADRLHHSNLTTRLRAAHAHDCLSRRRVRLAGESAKGRMARIGCWLLVLRCWYRWRLGSSPAY